jgi:hypothetical protein
MEETSVEKKDKRLKEKDKIKQIFETPRSRSFWEFFDFKKEF